MPQNSFCEVDISTLRFCDNVHTSDRCLFGEISRTTEASLRQSQKDTGIRTCTMYTHALEEFTSKLCDMVNNSEDCTLCVSCLQCAIVMCNSQKMRESVPETKRETRQETDRPTGRDRGRQSASTIRNVSTIIVYKDSGSRSCLFFYNHHKRTPDNTQLASIVLQGRP